MMIAKRCLCYIKALDILHSIRNHGLGYSEKSLSHEIEVKQNKILRRIFWSKKYCHVTKFYKSFELLKLQDIYKLELEKLIFKIVNNELLLNIVKNFTDLQGVHSYHTRQTKNSIFFLPSSQNAIVTDAMA